MGQMGSRKSANQGTQTPAWHTAIWLHCDRRRSGVIEATGARPELRHGLAANASTHVSREQKTSGVSHFMNAYAGRVRRLARVLDRGKYFKLLVTSRFRRPESNGLPLPKNSPGSRFDNLPREQLGSTQPAR